MTRRMRIEDLLALTVPSQPSVSPDGSSIAYVLSGNDAAADTAVSALWIADAAGSARQLTHGTTDASPAFSPDGSVIAFQRDGQLWTLPVAGGEPKQLTTVPLGAGAPVWSPGGTRIAFAAPVDYAASDSDGDAE
ncbi:MAG TPA: serine hydrolase, partial [Diaminobutyricibacter sp.]